MSNLYLFDRIKIHVLTDSMKDINLEHDDIIIIKIEEALSFYEDLLLCSSVHIKNEYLTAISNGQLVCLKILDNKVTWEDLNELNSMRKYYSEL
jgi:hypothetical protein